MLVLDRLNCEVWARNNARRVSQNAHRTEDNTQFWGELIELRDDGNEETIYATGFFDTEAEARVSMNRYIQAARAMLPGLKEVAA